MLRYSHCLQMGAHVTKSRNGADLVLDHDPPLTEAEREMARQGDRRAVDDIYRVGYLCATCHGWKHGATTQ